MARALRIEYPGACYHLMSRGAGGRRTFGDATDFATFLAGLAEPADDGRLEVFAFCLMSNHYHLLARTPRGALHAVMRDVNGNYAARFNRRHRRRGPVWQGRYRALVVESNEYLLECSRYIHLNPVQAGLARTPQGYRWSSWKNYVGGTPAVDWVDPAPVCGQLAGSRRAQAQAYRDYLREHRAHPPEDPFDRATAGVVLGSDAFVRRIRRRVARRPATREQPALRRLRAERRPGPAVIERVVDAVFAGATPGHARRLKLYALRCFSDLGPSAIARRHDRTPAAVTLAVRDLDARAETDRTFARRLRALARRLGVPRRDQG